MYLCRRRHHPCFDVMARHVMACSARTPRSLSPTAERGGVGMRARPTTSIPGGAASMGRVAGVGVGGMDGGGGGPMAEKLANGLAIAESDGAPGYRCDSILLFVFLLFLLFIFCTFFPAVFHVCLPHWLCFRCFALFFKFRTTNTRPAEFFLCGTYELADFTISTPKTSVFLV